MIVSLDSPIVYSGNDLFTFENKSEPSMQIAIVTGIFLYGAFFYLLGARCVL